MGNMNELMEKVRHRVTVADYCKMASRDPRTTSSQTIKTRVNLRWRAW